MFATGKLIMGGVEPPSPPEYEAVMVAADYSGVAFGYANYSGLSFGSLMPDDFVAPNTLVAFMYSAVETETEYSIQFGYAYPDRATRPPGDGWNAIHILGGGMDLTLNRTGSGVDGAENTRAFSFSKATTVPFIDGETYYLKYT